MERMENINIMFLIFLDVSVTSELLQPTSVERQFVLSEGY